MFIKRNIQTLREWWQSPVTIKERAVGALVGGIGGFWVGVFGRVVLGATPGSFRRGGNLGIGYCRLWSGYGYRFPQACGCYSFPVFSLRWRQLNSHVDSK